FKFVTPTGVKGKDYDVGIEYTDGREACADAKCRLEGTELRADTVKNSLNKARSNNLPPDKPGIIFVKVPQTWLEREDVRRGIYAVVEEFLRKHQVDRFGRGVRDGHAGAGRTEDDAVAASFPRISQRLASFRHG